MKIAVIFDSNAPFPDRDLAFAKIVAEATSSGLTGIGSSERGMIHHASYNTIYVDIISENLKQAQQDIDALETLFTKFCEKHEIKHEWTAVHGFMENEWRHLSPYIDLAIVPSGMSAAKLATSSVSGMLQLPERAEISDLTERCLIAWDGSPHAARALRASLPLLPGFKTVDVVMVDPERREDSFDVGAYLAAHDVEATVISEPSGSDSVSDVILYQATSADLLVLGAYGHSPVLEHLFGGVTEGISQHSRSALLFAH